MNRIDQVLRGDLEQAFHELYTGGSDPASVFEEQLNRYVTAIEPAGLELSPLLSERHVCLFRRFLQFGDDWFPYAAHLQGVHGSSLNRVSTSPPTFIKRDLWKQLVANREQFIGLSRRLEKVVSLPLRTILFSLTEKMRATPYHGRGCKDIEGDEVGECWEMVIGFGQIALLKREIESTAWTIRRNVESFSLISEEIERDLVIVGGEHPVASKLARSALKDMANQNDMALWFLGHMTKTAKSFSESSRPSKEDLEYKIMPRLIAMTYLPWLESFPRIKSHEAKQEVMIEGVARVANSIIPISQAHRYAAWFAFDEIHEEVFNDLMRTLDRFESNMFLSKKDALHELKEELASKDLERKFQVKSKRVRRMFHHFEVYQPYLAGNQDHASEWHKLWNKCALFVPFIPEFSRALHDIYSWSTSTPYVDIIDGVARIRRYHRAFFRKQCTSPLCGDGREPSPVEFVAQMFDYKREEGTIVRARNLGALPEDVDTRNLTDLLLDLVEGSLRLSLPGEHRVIEIVSDRNSVKVSDSMGTRRIAAVRTDLLSKLQASSDLTKLEMKYQENLGCTYTIHFASSVKPIRPVR
jgi:hypothetical protein